MCIKNSLKSLSVYQILGLTTAFAVGIHTKWNIFETEHPTDESPPTRHTIVHQGSYIVPLVTFLLVFYCGAVKTKTLTYRHIKALTSFYRVDTARKLMHNIETTCGPSSGYVIRHRDSPERHWHTWMGQPVCKKISLQFLSEPESVYNAQIDVYHRSTTLGYLAVFVLLYPVLTTLQHVADIFRCLWALVYVVTAIIVIDICSKES